MCLSNSCGVSRGLVCHHFGFPVSQVLFSVVMPFFFFLMTNNYVFSVWAVCGVFGVCTVFNVQYLFSVQCVCVLCNFYVVHSVYGEWSVCILCIVCVVCTVYGVCSMQWVFVRCNVCVAGSGLCVLCGLCSLCVQCADCVGCGVWADTFLTRTLVVPWLVGLLLEMARKSNRAR